MPAQKHGHRLFRWMQWTFFCKQVLHLFCDLPNDSFAEKCCKSLLFRRKNRYRAALDFRDICACLVCRQVGAQHEKNRFELQFQGLSTEDIELSVSDFERWTENELADGRGKLVSVGLEQGVKLFVLLRLPCDCNWISHTSRSLSAADTVFGFQNPENIRAVTVIVHRVRCNWADCTCEIPEPGVLGKEPQSQQKRRRLP